MSSKFDNAFSNLGAPEGVEVSDRPKINWKEVNQAQVDLFDTQLKAKSRVGVISGVTDLGLQPIDDAKMVWTGSADEEEAEKVKNPNTYFEDGVNGKTGKAERYKCWPQKPQRAVSITVDFPQFEFDWGEGIGKKPLRFLLNGEFVTKGSKIQDVIVGRTYDLKETTKDFSPRWSLAKNSLLYKLAVATEVISADEPFSKKDIGKLIGKHALFEARLWLEDGYLQDKISFKGEVPEGMAKPEYNEDILYYISLDGENDESHVKQLRRSVKNTIKRSVSYEGSKLKEQFGSVLFPVFNKGSDKPQDEEAVSPEPKVVEKKKTPPKEAKPVVEESAANIEDFGDVPF